MDPPKSGLGPSWTMLAMGTFYFILFICNVFEIYSGKKISWLIEPNVINQESINIIKTGLSVDQIMYN